MYRNLRNDDFFDRESIRFQPSFRISVLVRLRGARRCCTTCYRGFLIFSQNTPKFSSSVEIFAVQFCTILYNSVQFCTKFKNHDLSSQMSLLPIGWYGYIISATCESPRLRNRLRGAHHFCGDFGRPRLPKIELAAVSVEPSHTRGDSVHQCF